MNYYTPLRRIVGAVALAATLDAGAAQLTCLADHVAARPGTTVNVRAIPTEVPEGAELDIHWRATSGGIAGSGATAIWTLEKPGQATATATLTHQGQSAVCTIRLHVVQPTLSHAQIRKYFLVGDEPVPQGFSTYSYLLLGEALDPDEHENRQLVIAAFLRILEELSQSDSRSRDRVRNLTMIPVTSAPPPIVLEAPGDDRSWKWIVENFNYARAQQLLRVAVGEHGVGPFIVSSRESSGRTETLVQDLTGAHGAVAEQWVRLHIFLTTQERDWNGTEFRAYAVKTVNALRVFAEAVPEAIQGVSTAVTWIVQLRAFGE